MTKQGLQETLRSKGITQKELASYIGMTPENLSLMLKGRIERRVEIIVNLIKDNKITKAQICTPANK